MPVAPTRRRWSCSTPSRIVPVVLACRAGATHPCSDIVGVQEHTSRERHQVPDPWSGAIEQAPILFVSSNPSISTDEPYPGHGLGARARPRLLSVPFRGGPDHLPFVKDGTRFPLKDGGHPKRSVPFWTASRRPCPLHRWSGWAIPRRLRSAMPSKSAGLTVYRGRAFATAVAAIIAS